MILKHVEYVRHFGKHHPQACQTLHQQPGKFGLFYYDSVQLRLKSTIG
jgi:hypothetical protein